MAHFSVLPQPTTQFTITTLNDAFYQVDKPLISQISNWQAAFVASEGATEAIEFHLTAAKNTAIADSKTNDTNPVLNGLQIIPVVEFLQPSVTKDITQEYGPLEYGPLTPGDYVLMQVHGGVNVGGSQPKYAGGTYRFVHSTDTTPIITKLNYPELGRYTTGTEVAMAYAGIQYKFHHEGGYIQLSFDDITGHYADNVVTAGGETSAYIASGIAYNTTSPSNPIAPVFALINISTLNAQDTIVNPVLYCPAPQQIPATGLLVNMYSTTVGSTIYYTYTESDDFTIDPVEPPLPIINGDGSAGANTYIFDGTTISIKKPTKFKAVAIKETLTKSPVSSIYYFSKPVY